MDPVLKGNATFSTKVLKPTWHEQQWASNDKSTINQIQYNAVALLPGSIATA